MNLNDLLATNGYDPHQVLVFRHRPAEPELNRVLPWLAAEKAKLFNAYQQSQRGRLEGVMDKMTGNGFIASFIAHGAGKALFAGMYSIVASKRVTFDEFWSIPENVKMKEFGMRGESESGRESSLWFRLDPLDFYSHWKGRLIVGWPPPERSWWRRAHRNEMAIQAVLEDNALDELMPEWDKLLLTWDELGVLPKRWKDVLSGWRGIYFIFDVSDGKGYVGSAYGELNILGRWKNYASRGHGGNLLLRKRDPRNFRFTILQRVSPDMEAADVIRLEGTWKQRLHTRAAGIKRQLIRELVIRAGFLPGDTFFRFF